MNIEKEPLSSEEEAVSETPGAHWRALLIAAVSYGIWGITPVYWKLIEGATSFEILAHRLFWSSVFLLIICLFICRKSLMALFKEKRAVLILLGAGLLCTVNWGVYIYAVTSGNIIQTSIGYYINPLIVILLGLLVFKERLTKLQKIASILAAAGVIFFTFDYGAFPWISLSLALSFGLYGMLKKIGGYPALPALALETTLVVPLAIVYIIGAALMGNHAFLALDTSGALNTGSIILSLLLVGGGIITFVPLLLFSDAVNKVPLVWMGFLQYIAPTITLLLGVFVYGEAFTFAHTVCFVLIWAGLALIVGENLLKQRKRTKTSN